MLPLPNYFGNSQDMIKKCLVVFSNGNSGAYSGYALVNEAYKLSNTCVVTFPFYISYSYVNSSSFVQETVRKNSVFPTNRKSFFSYDANLIGSPEFSIPPKQFCSITDSPKMMMEVLPFLSKNYSKIILCRFQSLSVSKDSNLYMSIYNCSDVLPEEVSSGDSVWVKVYTEIRESIDLVFTNNECMFDYDGFLIDDTRLLGPWAHEKFVTEVALMDKRINDARALYNKTQANKPGAASTDKLTPVEQTYKAIIDQQTQIFAHQAIAQATTTTPVGTVTITITGNNNNGVGNL